MKSQYSDTGYVMVDEHPYNYLWFIVIILGVCVPLNTRVSSFYVPTPKSGEDSAVFRPEIVWHAVWIYIYIFNYIYISCTVSHDDGDRLC